MFKRSLVDFCIDRPVTTIVLQIFLLFAGYVAYSRLPVRQFPQIQLPQIQVMTAYPGASSALIEREITTRVEGALSGIQGIRRMHSSSRSGSSIIELELDGGAEVDSVMAIMRDRLSGIQSQLPDKAFVPQIYRQGSDNPLVMYLSVQAKPDSSKESLSDYVIRYIQPGLARLAGVSAAELIGDAPVALRIYPDPVRMAALGISIPELIAQLKNQNIALPAGSVRGEQRDYPIVLHSTLTDPLMAEQVIIRQQGDRLIRLKEVARVLFGSDPSSRQPVLLDGEPALVLKITADQAGNPLTVAEHVREYLRQLENGLPANMEIGVLYDATLSIQSSLYAVFKTLAEAVFLVTVVMWMFLGTFRASVIPLLTIPVCLLGVCVALYVTGCSVNNLTLLAAVLAIGLVVDDAIVMVERVFHHLANGLAVREAVSRAGHDMTFAILAMTTTLAAVYLPIGWMPGLVGQLFREFALALSGSVIISGWVALTWVPVLCVQCLNGPSVMWPGFKRVFESLEKNYQWLLRRLFTYANRWRIAGLLGTVFLLLSCVFLYRALPAEFVPAEDTDAVFVSLSPPVGANSNAIEASMRDLMEVGFDLPEAKKQLSFPGFHIIFLKSPSERNRFSYQIADGLRIPLARIPGLQAFPFVPPPLMIPGARMRNGIAWYIRSTHAQYDEMANVSQTLLTGLQKNAGIENWDIGYKPQNVEFVFTVDREKAAVLGVSIADIAQTMQILFAGLAVSQYETGGQLYDIWMQLPRYAMRTAQVISAFHVRSQSGKMIPLSSVLQVSENVAAPVREHVDRMRAIPMSGNLVAPYALQQAIVDLGNAIKKQLPPGFQMMWTGEADAFLQEGQRILWMFAAALLFIYLVLAAQFERFFDPLIILLTVPLSLIGALLILQITGGTLNIYTQIACMTLIGLISKHGILIVDFANRYRSTHPEASLEDAAFFAAKARFRAICMTTLAMTAGAIPLIWSTGFSANSRSQMGWTIFGGMTGGTFFSLCIIPLAYWMLHTLKNAAIQRKLLDAIFYRLSKTSKET